MVVDRRCHLIGPGEQPLLGILGSAANSWQLLFASLFNKHQSRCRFAASSWNNWACFVEMQRNISSDTGRIHE
jgi:hypothetical protein